ncbi:MAG: hypothetical protein KDK71_08985, partial [Chlamydiia bacterium]|nr:hypothetical protein [Chlamydiia bacterium]
MVCGTEGKVNAVIYYSTRDSIIFGADEVEGVDPNSFYIAYRTGGLRGNNRFCLTSGKKTQGDHIFAISTFATSLTNLLAGCSFEEVNHLSRRLLYPYFYGAYHFNHEYLELNKNHLKHLQCLDDFKDNFRREFSLLKFGLESVDEGYTDEIYRFLDDCCILYNNLPLLVHCDGNAGGGRGEWKTNSDLDRIKKSSGHSVCHKRLKEVLLSSVDQTALKRLMEQSNPESHIAIMGHFVLHLILIWGSLIEKSR